MKYVSGCSHNVSWHRFCLRCFRNGAAWIVGLCLLAALIWAAIT